MAHENVESNKQKVNNEDAAVKPDQETLNTTDPQEHMTGPFSSLAKNMEEDLEGEESVKGRKESGKE